MNVPLLSFSLISRSKRNTKKRSPKKVPTAVIVYADEFQDLSPTEEMINKRHSKNSEDNNINTLKKEIKKLKLMTDGQDHYGDIVFLKKQIKNLEKRHPKSSSELVVKRVSSTPRSSKKGGKKRTLTSIGF